MNTALAVMALAVSFDSAAAGLAMGSGGIKVPPVSAAVISALGAFFLCIPSVFGELISAAVDPYICGCAGKILLAVLGIWDLYRYFRKGRVKSTGFIDEEHAELADTNKDRRLSLAEAAVFSVGLSADSAVTGLSAGLSGMGAASAAVLFFMAFVIGFAAVEAGYLTGKHISLKMGINTGWLSGAVLILLAALI